MSPDPIRPGTRRIPLVPRDALADTERLLVSARDLLLAIEASYGGDDARAARAARQVFVDETLDELRRIAWRLRDLGTPVISLGGLAQAPKAPGQATPGLASLYSGAGSDLFGSHGQATRILRAAQSEVVRALTVVKVLASYGESAPRERGVGIENLSASGTDPSVLGAWFSGVKSRLQPGR